MKHLDSAERRLLVRKKVHKENIYGTFYFFKGVNHIKKHWAPFVEQKKEKENMALYLECAHLYSIPPNVMPCS